MRRLVGEFPDPIRPGHDVEILEIVAMRRGDRMIVPGRQHDIAILGGQPFLFACGVSKGALATLTRNAAYGLMPRRIRVNGLSIDWIATPGEDPTMRLRHGAQYGWLDEAQAKQPFGPLIDPREVAKAVTYLASGESGPMTGAGIDFDQTVPGAHDQARHDHATNDLERHAAAYRAELDAFVAACTGGKAPTPSGLDGLKAQILADVATESSRTGKPVAVALEAL